MAKISRMKYSDLKLRNKFLIPAIGIMFVSLLGFTIYLIHNQKIRDEAQLRDKADRITRLLAYSTADSLWDLTQNKMDNICKAFFEDNEVTAIRIKDGRDYEFVKLSKEIKGTNDIIKKTDIIKDNEKIGTAEVVFSNYHIEENLSSIRNRFIVLFLIMFSLITVLISVVSNIALIPLKYLMEGVRHFTEKDLGFRIGIVSSDEFGDLSASFNNMAEELNRHQEHLEELVEERTRQLTDSNLKLSDAMSALWSEMELAKKIQSCLLPKMPEISGYDIAASCEPADEVSGDYYDVISVGGYDWIVIGDVSGHGVTAGLVMMMVQTAIHTVLSQNPEVPPSQLLWVINRTLYENIARMDESKHITIIVLVCGTDGHFCFSGLHEDMLIRRAETGKVENISTDGMWIGLEPDISEMLSDNTLKLESGDCIVLYTDGIIEAKKDGGFFGDERLITLIETYGSRSAAEIHAAILDALKDYEKPDDVTLFVMKRCPN